MNRGDFNDASRFVSRKSAGFIRWRVARLVIPAAIEVADARAINFVASSPPGRAAKPDPRRRLPHQSSRVSVVSKSCRARISARNTTRERERDAFAFSCIRDIKNAFHCRLYRLQCTRTATMRMDFMDVCVCVHVRCYQRRRTYLVHEVVGVCRDGSLKVRSRGSERKEVREKERYTRSLSGVFCSCQSDLAAYRRRVSSVRVSRER